MRADERSHDSRNHLSTTNPTSRHAAHHCHQGDARAVCADLRAVWEYRELLYFLVWRDVKVRYKQTALGVTWVILQPVISTLVFTVIFGGLLNVPSNGLPYAVFAYAGLLPWQYFASALTRTSSNLVDNTNLITKVYFPRLIIPLSGVVASLVDFAVGSVMLAVLMLIFRIHLTWAVLLLPLFLLLAMITALGFGLWLSALNVRYRDIKQLLPFVVQLWMYYHARDLLRSPSSRPRCGRY